MKSELSCFACGARNQSATFCISCKNKFPFLTRIVAGSFYHDPIIKESIARFKYASEHALKSPLSTVMVPPFKKVLQGINREERARIYITPIPLFKKRMRMRGYNQAELLAKEIASVTHIPLLPHATLQRIHNTKPQASLSKDDRKENVKDAFTVSYSPSITKSTIVLVDDVATTGNTLIEAARILKQNGAKEVWGLVVAKG